MHCEKRLFLYVRSMFLHALYYLHKASEKQMDEMDKGWVGTAFFVQTTVQRME